MSDISERLAVAALDGSPIEMEMRVTAMDASFDRGLSARLVAGRDGDDYLVELRHTPRAGQERDTTLDAFKEGFALVRFVPLSTETQPTPSGRNVLTCTDATDVKVLDADTYSARLYEEKHLNGPRRRDLDAPENDLGEDDGGPRRAQ